MKICRVSLADLFKGAQLVVFLLIQVYFNETLKNQHLYNLFKSILFMEKNAKNPEEKSANDLGKFMGLGFQMLVIIALFTFVGYKLDAYFNNDMNLYTAILSLAGVLLALFQAIRLAKKN